MSSDDAPGDGTGGHRALSAAVVRGSLVGTAALVPVVVFTAVVVDRSSSGEVSPWRIPAFFAVLVAFALGGFVAARAVPDTRFTAGILAGFGAFVVWLPLRALTWWLRDDGRGLFSGADAVLAPGQVVSAALLAATLGLLGGILGGRHPQ